MSGKSSAVSGVLGRALASMQKYQAGDRDISDSVNELQALKAETDNYQTPEDETGAEGTPGHLPQVESEHSSGG